MVNEKRLIDAKAGKKQLLKIAQPAEYKGVIHMVVPISEIDKLPTVDAVEVVHGEWRKVYTCHGEQAWGYECNQCKADNPRATYYCPNCGAKMDGERGESA